MNYKEAEEQAKNGILVKRNDKKDNDIFMYNNEYKYLMTVQGRVPVSHMDICATDWITA
jgi:hypothetical protein